MAGQSKINPSKTQSLDLCEPQEIVNIHVAQNNGDKTKLRTFPLYKSILCRQSPFFDAAFNGPFIEGQSQSMALEDVGEEEFGMFVHYVHFRTIKGGDGTWSPAYTAPIKSLIKLWILGERFLVPQLQNDVLDILYVARGSLFWGLPVPQTPGYETFESITKDANAPSILRRFALDSILSCQARQLNDRVLAVMEPIMMKELITSFKAAQYSDTKTMMPPKEKYYVNTNIEEPNRRIIPQKPSLASDGSPFAMPDDDSDVEISEEMEQEIGDMDESIVARENEDNMAA